MRTTICLLLVLAIVGCSTSGALSGTMAGMQGHSINEAFERWGEPAAIEDLGDETMFVWRDYAAASVPIVICERMLAADASGMVTGWRWRGDACESVPARDRETNHYALAH